MKSGIINIIIIILLLFISENAFAEAECIGDVCGYDCTRYNGDVKCAKTPAGACLGYNGKLVCWDPDVKTRQKAECKGYNGQISCGYDCIGYNGLVKCAKTPQGTCLGYNGKLVCWDPDAKTHQKAECKGYNGRIACGYHCTSGNGTVKCAQTPRGTCQYNNGSVTCWDPEY